MADELKSVTDALNYEEPQFASRARLETRLEDLWGYYPQVTTTPTWTPTATVDSIAMDTTTGKVYYYDFTNKQWRTVSAGTTLTTDQTNAITGANSPSATNVFATLADFGILFGDASDGTVDLDGSNTYSFMSKSGSDYTLTRDVFASNFTIRTGVTLSPAGYLLFVKGTLTREGTGLIKSNGGNGGNGGDGTAGDLSHGGGLGGSAGSAGSGATGNTLPAGQAGLAGGAGGGASAGSSPGSNGSNGTNGTGTSNSVGSSGSAGGGGGAGGNGGFVGGSGGTAGSAGGAGAATLLPRAITQLTTLACWVSSTYTKYQGTAGSGSGSGGGGGCGNGTNYGGGGGGGGGSGGTGGTIVVFARKITASNSNVLFQATGGNGGNGGNGGDGGPSNPGFERAGGGGGGGGGGGSGGVVGVVTTSSDQTLTSIISVAGGSAGSGGTKGAPSGTGPGAASDGSSGTAGSTGVYYIFTP